MELKKSLRTGKEVTQLLTKKLGRWLTLVVLDSKVQLYLPSFRANETPNFGRIVTAAAEGIEKATDRALLHEIGGHILLGSPWAYTIFKKDGLCTAKRYY